MAMAIFVGLIPFLLGTFYDFSVLFVTAIFSIVLLIILIKNRKLQININNRFILSISLIFFSLLTIIWGIDKNNAFVGTLRYISVFIFVVLLMQLSKKSKDNIIDIIPYSGIIMLIISVIMGFFPNLKEIVYSESNRITGFFQYSNTFALYLLIGFIIITNKNTYINKAGKINNSTNSLINKVDNVKITYEEKSKRTYINENMLSIIISIILLIGIIMTGSRTTFIITTIYIIYISFRKENKNRKLLGITYFIIISIIGVYVLITKNLDTIGRIFTVSLNSSTLLRKNFILERWAKTSFRKFIWIWVYGIFI